MWGKPPFAHRVFTVVLPCSQGGKNHRAAAEESPGNGITEMTTSTHPSGHTPIYEELVEEQGDILAQAREAAEHSQLTASRALDWSDLRRRE